MVVWYDLHESKINKEVKKRWFVKKISNIDIFEYIAKDFMAFIRKSFVSNSHICIIHLTN